MSRIGRKPVPVPKGVEVSVKDGEIKVKGPKGELYQKIPPCCKAVSYTHLTLPTKRIV